MGFIEAVDLAIMIGVFLLIFFVCWRKWELKRKVWGALFYGYCCVVILLTLAPVAVSFLGAFQNISFSMNLVPFIDVMHERGDYIRQIILNVLLTMPLAFLLCAVLKKQRWIVPFVVFLASVCIELLQPILNSFRASDITDIITNTIGGILGYLLFLVAKPLLKKWKWIDG
ncbi:MAG: VanZ family protein [Clostridia bacterium]|nr:VanZ family protein [Clostridia bacterium]